jgi:hypothetical protein
MIQRIQSVWLLLASLSIFALFAFPLVHNVYVGAIPQTIKITGVYQDVAGQMVRSTSFLILTIVTIVMGILPLIILMRFKDRKQQIALCYSLVLVLIGYSFWMSQTVKGVIGDNNIKVENMGIGVLLTSVSIVCVLGAIRGIKNDEKLVKSADRLR